MNSTGQARFGLGLLLASVSLLACGPAMAPEDAASVEQAATTVCAPGPTVEGIDVSYWQGTGINWSQVKAAGKQFVFVRVAHGLDADANFAKNWAGAKQAGLMRGAYAWLSPQFDVATQANMMISAMATLQADDLPPVIDVEEVGGRTKAQIAAAVTQWVTLVKNATGRTPIIYTNSYFWESNVASNAFASYLLWAPHYNVSCPRIAAPWSTWAFHQYSSTGMVAGINAKVDLNRFNGTLAQLQALTLGQPTTPGTGVLTGAIYRGTDIADRIAGATVTVGSTTQTTGADGMYKFTLAPGSYTVTASKVGFTTASVSRTVTTGATIWGSIGLSPSTSSGTPPTLTLTSPADGSSVDVAQVTVAGSTTAANGQPISSLMLSVNGAPATAVSVAAGGAFSRMVTLEPGLNQLELTATDAAGNATELQRSVRFRAGVSGTVRDATTSAAVTAAAVQLLSSTGDVIATSTGAQFSFDVDAVPGDFTLSVSATGFVSKTVPLHLTATARATADVSLSADAQMPQTPTVRFTNLTNGTEVDNETIDVEGEVLNVPLGSVTVNGVPATLNGNTFSAQVPLAMGVNVVAALAQGTDGSTATAQVTVKRVEPQQPKGGCAVVGFEPLALMVLAAALRRAQRHAAVR